MRRLLLSGFAFACFFFVVSASDINVVVKVPEAVKGSAEEINAGSAEDITYGSLELKPITGWSRHFCDSARSWSGWVRWWTFLRMKEPVISKWKYDLLLKIYPKNEVFRALYVRGEYDPNHSVVVNSLLTKDGVFVDVGANAGISSLLASRVIGATGTIIAIEPCERDFARLVDNIKLNKLEKIIRPIKLAVADKPGSAKLLVANEERSELSTICEDFRVKNIEKVTVEDVEARSLDQILEKEALKKIDVIQFDVEGSDYNAFVGAKSTVEKHRPAVIIRINDGSHMADFKKVLADIRYKAYKIQEEPEFKLVLIGEDSDSCLKDRLVIFLHESVVPPSLPQPAANQCCF